jgi:hypothetical protein
LDSSQNVYLNDYGNHRVLFFSGTSTTATRVYGQAGFTTGLPNRGGSVSGITMSYPYYSYVDSASNLYGE